jgi:hypothetical protein
MWGQYMASSTGGMNTFEYCAQDGTNIWMFTKENPTVVVITIASEVVLSKGFLTTEAGNSLETEYTIPNIPSLLNNDAYVMFQSVDLTGQPIVGRIDPTTLAFTNIYQYTDPADISYRMLTLSISSDNNDYVYLLTQT